jgi:hypothetical protein
MRTDGQTKTNISTLYRNVGTASKYRLCSLRKTNSVVIKPPSPAVYSTKYDPQTLHSLHTVINYSLRPDFKMIIL